MGNLVWHEYARYVALSATACECPRPTRTCCRGDVAPVLTPTPKDTIWSAFWGFYYRKYFFDFVNGIIRSPGGVQ